MLRWHDPDSLASTPLSVRRGRARAPIADGYASTMPDEVTVIRAGALLDVERGELVADQAIVVRDGRIEAILSPNAPAPVDATSIDLSGLTVLPGPIDCHTH
jgi:imidazolonepropionase-like amidohydrolase